MTAGPCQLLAACFGLHAGAGSREGELMDALRIILDKLNSGHISITEEMVRRAQSAGLLGTSTVSGAQYIPGKSAINLTISKCIYPVIFIELIQAPHFLYGNFQCMII